MANAEDELSKYSTRIVNGRSIDTSLWPTPDEGALDGETFALYFARKKAVSLYLAGAQSSEIQASTGLGKKEAYRLIRERCLETHPDGQVYGWRGLIPYLRIHSYNRHTKVHIDEYGSGGAGALEYFLDVHPEIRLSLNKRITSVASNTKLKETKVSFQRHWTWFVDELRRRGFEARKEWPFNTASLGYYSIRRYAEKVLAADKKSLAAISGGPDLIRKLRSGDGSNRPELKFLERVEMDAHKLDGRFCVCVPAVGGGTTERIVHRLWVISLIDVASRVVLGYYFSVGKEVSSDDVLRAIKCSLTKWIPKKISFSDKPYVQGAGLLSALGDEYTGLCWNETSVDGALAETCTRVERVLKDAVGSTLLSPKNSFAKRLSLDDRPFIEAFFRNLAGGAFQRLTNTTGAKPKDKKGRDPEKVALSSRFQYEYAEELLDVIIANYNATPHASIGRRSPLTYAKLLFEGSSSRYRPADLATVEALLSVRKLCRVRGGAKVGRSVYIEFFHARYSNEILQNRQDLVGSKIWVIHHKENDGRVALASTQNGVSLGVLRAAPPWHISPHSLGLRRSILQAEAQGKFNIPSGSDGIELFLNYVEAQPGNKLPVHPAYLEARRILTLAAEQFVGDALLEQAQSQAKALNDQASPNGLASSSTIKSLTPGSVAKVKSASSQPLPPRRIASTRS